MSDIKLFKLSTPNISELAAEDPQIEKALQVLFEKNLEIFLGVRFLATEYSTGPIHGGRIDTLGVDEDGSPVIIEYKRSITENVINQGLFYLDWLMDHRGDFELLVQKKLGKDSNIEVDWSGPRLICIAGDFTRYDEHAVKQISRNIELLRYKRFESDLLMIELVHAPNQNINRTPLNSEAKKARSDLTDNSDPYQSQRIAYRISQMQGNLRDLYETVFHFLEGAGDDVQVKELMNYIAFKRIKNFACLEVFPSEKFIRIYLKVDLATISLEDGFTRDVTNVGHFGTGNLQVTIKSIDDFKKAQPLITQSYDKS